jgi:Asp-tRNA(Asn)/Glu-tRNA(Gln) amidotransferase A subunit family amidase
MASDELCWLSATDLAALIRRRKVSPVEVIDAVLERIGRRNPQLNAYVTVTAEEARRAARAAERALGRRRPSLGPLHGVPFSVKDVVITIRLRGAASLGEAAVGRGRGALDGPAATG